VVNSPGIFDPRFSWHGSSAAENANNVNRQGLTPMFGSSAAENANNVNRQGLTPMLTLTPMYRQGLTPMLTPMFPGKA
jgi:hypothetical protein